MSRSIGIAKHEVVRAYKRVKANGGAAGADGVSLKDFERGLQDNLYRIWNRLCSGSYLAPPVKRVEIEKADGKKRPLGIPTVGDRIAQMVIKQRLEPLLEPLFHANSYGYRPGRSAHDAVKRARRLCWKHDWVLDLDIQGFFDNIDWKLMMRAVRQHARCEWLARYVERWLRAEVILPDGQVQQRDRGTPQGGVISPLLANLFLHYAFDEWMRRNHGEVSFERYADDIICHCDSQAQAQALRAALQSRLAECGLRLHPEKTRIVYCADADRRESAEQCRFDFLGFSFKPRNAGGRGKVFTTFTPAVSDKALAAIRQKVRGWKLSRRGGQTLEELCADIRPQVQGWVNYYAVYRPSTLYRALRVIDAHLVQWARRKYKRLESHRRRAWEWLKGLQTRMPRLLPHWWAAIRSTG